DVLLHQGCCITSPTDPGTTWGYGQVCFLLVVQIAVASSPAVRAESAVSSKLATEAKTLTQAARVGPATSATPPAASATSVVVSSGLRQGCVRSHNNAVWIVARNASVQRLAGSDGSEASDS